jgi:hypothetical protein
MYAFLSRVHHMDAAVGITGLAPTLLLDSNMAGSLIRKTGNYLIVLFCLFGLVASQKSILFEVQQLLATSKIHYFNSTFYYFSKYLL